MITNLKFQHKPKLSSFKFNPHIKNTQTYYYFYLGAYKNPLSYYIILYNESKHNILALVGKAKKPNISVVLPIQGYPKKKKLKKGRRKKEGRNKGRRSTQSPCSCGCVRDCLWINFTSQEWQQKFRYLTTRIFLLLFFVLVKKIDREQSGKWRVERVCSPHQNTTWKKV